MASDNNPPPPAMPSSVPSRIRPEAVKTAVNSLLNWKTKESKTQKSQLLPEDDYIYLVLTLKKIPQQGRTTPYKIPLPHPLHPNDSDLCLIVDDRSKSKLNKEAITKKLQSENIQVSNVLKLSKLKSKYRSFEEKRKLFDTYEIFMADKRIIPLMPTLLGKQFYKKKKIPVPVDLGHKNWKEQIEGARGSALLCLKTGTCSSVKVGKSSMGRKDIMENVVAAINGVVEVVPKKWMGVRSFHLKFSESLALPVYQVLPDMKMMKIEGVKEKEDKVKEIKEPSKNKDEKMGKKGRIHEVRYMDNNMNDLSDEEEVDLDGDEDKDISEGEKEQIIEFGSKKRKKDDFVKGQVISELNGEKRSKKVAKLKKVE